MTPRGIAAAALASCIAAGACRQADAARREAHADSTTLVQRETRLEHSLSQRNTTTRDTTAERKAVARWVMPRDLDELSGIALTRDFLREHVARLLVACGRLSRHSPSLDLLNFIGKAANRPHS